MNQEQLFKELLNNQYYKHMELWQRIKCVLLTPIIVTVCIFMTMIIFSSESSLFQKGLAVALVLILLFIEVKNIYISFCRKVKILFKGKVEDIEKKEIRNYSNTRTRKYTVQHWEEYFIVDDSGRNHKWGRCINHLTLRQELNYSIGEDVLAFSWWNSDNVYIMKVNR